MKKTKPKPPHPIRRPTASTRGMMVGGAMSTKRKKVKRGK